ncbi:hypothetical protein [Planctomicrobium piriforme]|uniref:Uncharacterized protein n=1 Tax=Planctomicrobium piriforme TaxID=1576369 RepID=A0A1I3RAZ1_9PLAN|nr:hypothetical protein [Planctomicrobium piriforme]SFJ42487.1 hypothetical protein SAMN05421753_12039 [Planctomicrobium piriforme]
MDNRELTLTQVDKLTAKFSGLKQFLDAVKARMDALSFEPTDPLYLRVCDARDAARVLLDELARVRQQNIPRLTEPSKFENYPTDPELLRRVDETMAGLKQRRRRR